MSNPTDPYYGTGYDQGRIENAYTPEELEEGIDYMVLPVTEADGTTTEQVVRRPRP